MWHLYPSVRRFLAKKHRKCRRRWRAGAKFPLIQVCGQTLAYRFARIEAENPAGIRQPHVLGRGCIRDGVGNTRAIVTSERDCVIVGAMVDDDNMVTGIERLQAAAQPKSVIFCVQQCSDGRHEEKSVRESGLIRRQVSKEASQTRVYCVARNATRLAQILGCAKNACSG